MKTRTVLGAAPIALTLLLASQSALAVDWTGYFRAGPGLTTGNANRACYKLNGGTSGLNYRLGNECDFYGEFQLSQGFEKDGIKYSANLMTNYYKGTTDNDGGGLAIEQMWAQAQGFDIAPEATFWIGKERGRRGDVHIVDTQFIEMLGVGAGAKGFKAGPGKLGLAFYKTDKDVTKPGNRFNLEWVDAPANADGKISLFATLTQGDFDGGTKGAGLTFKHEQANLFGSAGLSNTVFLQFAQGSAALNANFGDLSASSAAKSWRLVETMNWQKGAFGGQVLALAASEKNSAGLKTDSSTLGGRVSYALTRNFKLVTELGVSQYKPQGGETARLTKLTIAPTLAVGPEFWSRPEFRLYTTLARWNTAAGNVTGQTAFDGKTSGTSYGAQVEWWF
jgi:maltoporin